MSSPQYYDLVIVGNGLAGLTAALALRHFPGSIALIGQQPWQTKPTSESLLDQRNIGLSENSRHFLTALGVWESLASSAAPVNNIHVSEQGAFGVTRIRASEEGLSALAWIVPAPQLQQALYQGLEKQDRLRCKIPATVQSLRPGNDQTLASISIEEEGQAKHISAQLIILADGGQSDLHQQAGFSSRLIDYQQTAIVFNIMVAADTQQQVYERFTRRGLIAILPLAKNHCGVVWVHPTGEAQKLLSMEKRQFCQRMHEAIGDRLGQIVEIGSRQAYPLRLRWTEDIFRRRIVLLGNAAHTLHPVAAQGFNLSVRDVDALAKYVLQNHQDPGRTDQQSSYQRQRQRDGCYVMSFTHSLIRFFSLPLGPLRGGLLCMLDLLPPLRRMIVHNMLSLSMEDTKSTVYLPKEYESR